MTRFASTALVLFGSFAFTGCVVENRVYENCFDGSDCAAPADGCYSIPGVNTGILENICSLQCTSDFQCPDSFFSGQPGACLSVDGTPLFFCNERCDFDSDCRFGFLCAPTTTGDRICFPD
ncbi:MAG: hypothetical protein AAGF12_04670 [Myxococcota bacterium]